MSPVWVATVTAGTAVNIVPYAAVVAVRGRFRMAGSRAGEDRIVRRARVAGGARVPYALCMRPGSDGEPCVVEGGAGPLCGGVACFAGSWETGGDVVGIRCCVVYGAVTAVAVRGSALEHAIHMAAGTACSGVLTRESETCCAVVERGSRPLRRVVARLAGLRESRGDMVRIRGGLEFLQMTGNTGRRQARKLIVHMAGGAAD